MVKLVDSNHYHLWTDALHAKALVHEARNKWDRGTYVRWTVTTAWTVLEIACQDALEEPNISRSFKKNLNKAIANRSLKQLDWSHGIWKEVSELLSKRKRYVHQFQKETDLFPEGNLADEAIATVRKAVADIYTCVNKKVPSWIRDDYDQGWAQKGFELFASGFQIPPGLDIDAPDTIKITYVYKDTEHIWKILPSLSDTDSHISEVLESVHRPISSVRIYRGNELICKRDMPIEIIRGS